MNQILVGYDGSEAAGHALDQACLIAKAYGCPLTVLTAADDRLVREDGHVTMAADEDLAKWTAEQGAQRARAAGVQQVHPEVSIEAPLPALVHAAEQGDYDLVVVGHRGLGALKELFLGSTAKSLVDKVTCSVLVVR
jgi:nucleotide-binding universal stress UspA family protein